jgi:membrane protein implicated in regulation of membrane protease activity
MILVAGFVAFVVLGSPWGVFALGAAVLVEVGELYLWTRYLRRFRVQTGPEGLVGERAEVLSACRPLGSVRVHGEIWSAECRAGADPGEPVVVSRVDGLKLVIERAAEASQAR